MLTTCGDLIAYALRVAGVNGVGQTPIAEDFSDGMTVLTSMIGQWQRKRWLVPTLSNMSIVSTGALNYTIGPTGDFAVPRPDKIDSAFARFLTTPGPVTLDYPLAIIESWEDYNTIVLKNLATIPLAIFYDSAFPVGKLYVWPVPPSGQYEIHIAFKAALPVYTALTDPLNLAPEYMEALQYGMAIRLALNYGTDPRPAHVAAYRAALNTIRVANTQISELGMPPAVLGRGGGGLAASSDPGFQSGWRA